MSIKWFVLNSDINTAWQTMYCTSLSSNCQSLSFAKVSSRNVCDHGQHERLCYMLWTRTPRWVLGNVNEGPRKLFTLIAFRHSCLWYCLSWENAQLLLGFIQINISHMDPITTDQSLVSWHIFVSFLCHYYKLPSTIFISFELSTESDSDECNCNHQHQLHVILHWGNWYEYYESNLQM